MLSAIIRKEFLDKVSTLRFFIALLLSFGLTTISASVLSSNYAQELADYHARVKLHAETKSEGLVIVDRKPSVLSVLFPGIENNSARSVRLEVDLYPETIETIDDNPLSVLFETVDWTFIIGIVMSLLAILFAYDTVCGERETGTLALMASNSTPKPMLILGKWIGGYLSLILPCLVGWFSGFLILITDPQIQLTAADLSSVGWLLFGALLYLACVFALGVLVSTLTSRSSTAIVALLLLWGVGVFVIPNLGPDLAKVIYPIPSFASHAREMKLVEKDLQHQRQQWHDEASLEVIDKRMLLADAWKVQVDTEARFINAKKEALSKLTVDYRRKVQQQEQIAAAIAALSPYACFTSFVTQLAGTDSESEAQFIATAERFDREYFDELSRVLQHMLPHIETETPIKKRNEVNFSHTELTVNERLKSGFVPLCLLLLFTTLFLIGGYAAFLRYDVKP